MHHKKARLTLKLVAGDTTTHTAGTKIKERGGYSNEPCGNHQQLLISNSYYTTCTSCMTSYTFNQRVADVLLFKGYFIAGHLYSPRVGYFPVYPESRRVFSITSKLKLVAE